ncbi:MAG: AMP-binding protein [Deltaproteobacteria bacterium]|nr:AMP-binding protein [Deltaproteobacteria bacterium]
MGEDFVSGLFSYEMEEKYEKMPDLKVITFENGEYADEPITYADIFLNGCRLAKALKDLGIGKGDKFSLVMRNHPEFLYSMLAASFTGAVVVPIDPRAKGGKLSYQLKDSDSKGVIFSNEFMEEMERTLKDISGLKVIGVAYKEGYDAPYTDKYPSVNEILSGPEVSPPDDRNKDIKAPFEIIYTSGTTGNPKGVTIKGDRMPMFKTLSQFIWQYTENDVLYTGLSLTHGNAQAITLVPAITLGIPAVISRRFTKSRIWDICRKYGATTFSLLGGMMMGIYSEPRKPNDADNPVRLVISAGTPIPIWKEFEERFNVKIHEWYGAVEGGFAHNPPGVGPMGSFGKPLDGILEMKVVREDDTECKPGEIGELIFRPVQGEVEVEYHGKKEASEQKTRGGWLRSGDMCHADEDGWFYFDFRKGGGLRRQGDFIQPEYIEKILGEQPEITDVCVYGIPAASGAPGESDIVGAIVLVEGKEVDPKKIFKALSEGLESNAIPSYLQVVDEIPKSASQKNLDRVLKDEFRKDAPNVFKFSDFK